MEEKNSHKQELIFLVVAAIAFVLNITEMILILRERKKWKPFDKFLLSFSIADMIVAISTLGYMVLVLNHITISDKGPLTTDHLHFVILTSGDMSFLHILVITIDRYAAVRYPFQHKIRMQGRFTNALIAAVWGLCILMAGGYLAMMVFQKSIKTYCLKATAVVLIIMGLIYAALYVRMFKLVLRQNAALCESQPENGKPENGQTQCPIKTVIFASRCKKERNLMLTSMLVVMSYILCIYPFSINMLAVSGNHVSFPSQLFLLINSAINPAVYFFKGYRERRIRNQKKQEVAKYGTETHKSSSSRNTGTLFLKEH
eukprot:Seg3593.2 transcript_id=Seg3593.2/GoldUCD/mRNA.D3Y31 product="Melanocortin receptor 5" protein_id=Seg3593.2/GoldUCD/D3Y31